MGRKLTASEETRLLQDTIRQGHELLAGLRTALREAGQLAPDLVDAFERHHQREMQQLSDHLNREGNRMAAELNASVHTARQEIIRQLAFAELIIDPKSDTVKIKFSADRFDDQVPPPRTTINPRETSK